MQVPAATIGTRPAAYQAEARASAHPRHACTCAAIQVHSNTQLVMENSRRQLELKAKEEELAGLKAEAARTAKVRCCMLHRAMLLCLCEGGEAVGAAARLLLALQ